MAELVYGLSQVPRLPLIHAGTNITIPQLGLGTAFIHDIPRIIPAALFAGYRLFDSAVMYGNESEIGQSLEMVCLLITKKRVPLRSGQKYISLLNFDLKL